MLFTIDIGNTNIVYGIFEKDNLKASFRQSTSLNITVDEVATYLNSMFLIKKLEFSDIDGIIIACVVPPIQEVYVSVCKRYFGIDPIVVGPGIKTGIQILYENPKEVGADRIVNAVGALEKYKRSCIIIDFGTATTFDAVRGTREYLGGAIAPGIGISMDALFSRTSKLPRVDFKRPPSVIGKNTVNSIQSGVVFGYIGIVDNIVRLMRREMNEEDVLVVATGGFAEIIAEESLSIEIVDPNLTLDGLRFIYERNKG
ncbi:MAG: type III pantothenate kinase [Deltaproteobacteria bacterium]|nr:type III pantothenate kinase [Deltaproteobacteria bacterium]